MGEINVRWSHLEDEPWIAELLELNGMSRWLAFDEQFIVAEKEGELLAALRYRTQPKRLLLELLVAHPWAEEHTLAVALYAGAIELAWEMGVGEVLARLVPYADYPYEAGYHLWGPRVAGRYCPARRELRGATCERLAEDSSVAGRPLRTVPSSVSQLALTDEVLLEISSSTSSFWTEKFSRKGAVNDQSGTGSVGTGQRPRAGQSLLCGRFGLRTQS